MKTIGLIGGMSWESSLEYYRILNETVKEKKGEPHSCEIIMYSVDFAEYEKLQHEGKWEILTCKMIVIGKKLEKAGADVLLICTNTMHKTADKIQKSIEIPLLHIADATAEKIKSKNINKVGLLGTRFTMEEDFYKKRLKEQHGIEVVIPDKYERKVVHNVIYDELISGVIKEESKNKFKMIINSLKENGAEGVILGCTEIPLLINSNAVIFRYLIPPIYMLKKLLNLHCCLFKDMIIILKDMNVMEIIEFVLIHGFITYPKLVTII